MPEQKRDGSNAGQNAQQKVGVQHGLATAVVAIVGVTADVMLVVFVVVVMITAGIISRTDIIKCVLIGVVVVINVVRI